jgi:signal transduction histidine kinase
VGGVFELIQDISHEYQSLVRFQYLIFGLSIVIMGFIFLALLLIVHKAEKMIDERVRTQRELEAQLHQKERLAALGEMVAAVSHEIRNPLGIIHSTAELLGGMPGANASQKQLSPHLEQCDLKEIIEKNLLFIAPELEKRKIEVSHNLDGKSVMITGDRGLLYRAFLNILINASQAIDNGGHIGVTLWEAPGLCRIEIEDSGSGIKPENIKKIFNPFFTTKEKGSGLGLPIVQKIVEAHNGSISVESTEGKGTRVKISLPRQGV